MTSTEFEPSPPPPGPDPDGDPIQNERPKRVSYWGAVDEVKHFLPDGEQYFVIKKMNEGDRAKFERATTKDFVVEKGGDSRVKVDVATNRHELIMAAVTGWHMWGAVNTAHEEPFRSDTLRRFISNTDPSIIDELEKAIRKHNPFLSTELSSEEIQDQIDDLQNLLEVTREREAGEASSSSR